MRVTSGRASGVKPKAKSSCDLFAMAAPAKRKAKSKKKGEENKSYF